MTPEQYRQRRKEEDSREKAAKERAEALAKYRKVLEGVFRQDTGEDATVGIIDSYGEEQVYFSDYFTDWLILRYVEAAGCLYSMAEADKKALADQMQENSERPPTEKERELVKLYVGKEGN